METIAAKYREFAEECEKLAKIEQSERNRSVLMEMADVWRELSAEADKNA